MSLLLFGVAGIDFVAGVLRLEEIYKLKDVGGGRHPLGRVRGVVVLFET